MKNRSVRAWMLAVTLVSLLLLGGQTRIAQAKGASPEGFLNADGTLNLDGSFNGALDLHGWNAQMDLQRGPVFALASNGTSAPAVAGPWSILGSGLEALNSPVYAIAISGTDVYLGGDFSEANGIDAADYIAK